MTARVVPWGAVAVLVLLAAGCVTAAPRVSAVATIDGAHEDRPAKSVNDDEVLRMLERELDQLSPEASWGTTRVWLNVDVEGIVRSVEIAESSGNAQLDAIVLRVMRHLRYEPALRAGKPVEARIPHSVTLSGDADPAPA